MRTREQIIAEANLEASRHNLRALEMLVEASRPVFPLVGQAGRHLVDHIGWSLIASSDRENASAAAEALGLLLSAATVISTEAVAAVGAYATLVSEIGQANVKANADLGRKVAAEMAALSQVSPEWVADVLDAHAAEAAGVVR